MKRKRANAHPRLFGDDDRAFVEIRPARVEVLHEQVGLLAGRLPVRRRTEVR